MRRLAVSALMAAIFLAAPALADVQAGADAWQRGDYEAAVGHWRTDALAGDAKAQFNLGQAYKLGRGVPVDLAQAEEWYRLAALQGLPDAENNYGYVLFENGKRREAMQWIRKAATRGEPRAQYVLGTAFFNGDLAERDWPRAYALMRLSAAGGVTQAQTSLAHMEKYLPAEDKRRGLALAGGPVSALLQTAAAVKPATPPASPAPAPAPSPAPAGKWRVQLGAFGQEARARALWSKLSGDIPALASLGARYSKAKDIVRLQAGPIATKREADRLCETVKAAGNPCFPVES